MRALKVRLCDEGWLAFGVIWLPPLLQDATWSKKRVEDVLVYERLQLEEIKAHKI